MSRPPAKNPKRIRSMFGNIAPRYDLLNRILSLGMDTWWRQILVSKVRGDRIIDLACGTGDVIELIDRRRDVKRILGIDFSMNMLSRARNRLSDRIDCLSIMAGSALTIPVRRSSFDSVTCAFGVRNFSSRSQALREIKRVLKPGGKCVILEFFNPGDRWLSLPAKLYTNYILPWIGYSISGTDAYSYLSESIDTFITISEFEDELVDAGFRPVESISVLTEMVSVVVAKSDEEKNR